jgi:hypothetical protein
MWVQFQTLRALDKVCFIATSRHHRPATNGIAVAVKRGLSGPRRTERRMPFGTYGPVIDDPEPPPLEPLAKPSADIFGAALLCGSPNLGKAIGISFNRFALHCACSIGR